MERNIENEAKAIQYSTEAYENRAIRDAAHYTRVADKFRLDGNYGAARYALTCARKCLECA